MMNNAKPTEPDAASDSVIRAWEECNRVIQRDAVKSDKLKWILIGIFAATLLMTIAVILMMSGGEKGEASGSVFPEVNEVATVAEPPVVSPPENIPDVAPPPAAIPAETTANAAPMPVAVPPATKPAAPKSADDPILEFIQSDTYKNAEKAATKKVAAPKKPPVKKVAAKKRAKSETDPLMELLKKEGEDDLMRLVAEQEAKR
jgi:type IV secretory pathway VirB10-like protein